MLLEVITVLVPSGYLVIGIILFFILLYFLVSRLTPNIQIEKRYEEQELVIFMVEKLSVKKIAKDKKIILSFLEENYKDIRLDFNKKTNQPFYVVPDRRKLFEAIIEKYMNLRV